MYYLPTGIEDLDKFLLGGLPCGAVTELLAAPDRALRVIIPLLRYQQQRYGYALVFWLDLNCDMTSEKLAAMGLDPDGIILVTTDNIEDLAQMEFDDRWGDRYTTLAGIILSGLPERQFAELSATSIYKRTAAILRETQAFMLFVNPPAERHADLARPATLRLRLSDPVAAGADEQIATLLKHWRGPGARARRLRLPA